jgi:hypothetical protein
VDHPTGTCVTVKKNPKDCEKSFVEVCGCDGHDYPGDCERIIAGVQKKHDGRCKPGDNR